MPRGSEEKVGGQGRMLVSLMNEHKHWLCTDSDSPPTVWSAYNRVQDQDTHCTETALLSILNDLLAVYGRGNNALFVLLDFSASFDTIDHTLLHNRFHFEICLDKCSPLTCLVGPNKFFLDIFCRWRLLSVVPRRDQCSAHFSFLSAVGGTHSKVQHRLPPFLPMILS